MGLSRWDTVKAEWAGGPPNFDDMIAYHRGYILALQDTLDDLDEQAPEESHYPHHRIRFLIGRSLDEAERSLLAVQDLQQGRESE